jgi:hypothetical protein
LDALEVGDLNVRQRDVEEWRLDHVHQGIH